jgi:hypothetical protein
MTIFAFGSKESSSADQNSTAASNMALNLSKFSNPNPSPPPPHRQVKGEGREGV